MQPDGESTGLRILWTSVDQTLGSLRCDVLLQAATVSGAVLGTT